MEIIAAFKTLAIIYLCRSLKNSFLLISLSFLMLLDPVSAKPLAMDSAAITLEQSGSQWLDQWGHSEINLTGNSSKTLQGGGALLLPWLQGEQQLLFTQIGGYFGKKSNLLNTGIGQRWFTDQGHWGYNLFYDYRFKNHHQRLGLGLEWQHNNLSVALNGYQPLADKRLIADTPESKTFEHTARGFDVHCQYRLPQHPQLRLNLIGERYLGEIVHNNSIVHNHSAVTVGFDYTPIPLITASYGFNLDNAQNKTHQLQLALTYRLGVPLAEQFEPQQVHVARSSLSNWLELVRRNHKMILKQLVEHQELKTEDNEDGASPQNTPPEGDQKLEVTQSPEEHQGPKIVDNSKIPAAGLHTIYKVKKCNSVDEALALLGLSHKLNLSPNINLNTADDTIHRKIRRTYRELALDYHPDKSGRRKTVEQNKELRDIRFETLRITIDFLKKNGLKD